MFDAIKSGLYAKIVPSSQCVGQVENYTLRAPLDYLLGRPTAAAFGSFRPAKSGPELTLSRLWTINLYGDRVSEIGNFKVKVNKSKQFFFLSLHELRLTSHYKVIVNYK